MVAANVRPLGHEAVTTDETATMTHRPELVAHGVRLGERVVPLLAGSVHYYHLSVEHWGPALTALVDLGVSFVDTYVPWSMHERAGSFDFGNADARLNVRAFLELARELGLLAIVRPGPHVNAELTGFGIPKRVLWDEECMARAASGARVVLPIPPLSFPLPSYASQKFHEETAAWYRRLGREIGDLYYPHGPIVLVQVDNEAALGFRDGVFDQDYHPSAVAAYRAFLAQKYTDLDQVRRLYKNPALSLAKANPPQRSKLRYTTDLPPALDWAEAQEHMIAQAIARMAAELRSLFPGTLLTHNLPPGFELSALDPALLEPSLDLLGVDFYHRASTRQRRAILQRTSELRWRSEVAGNPCYAAELGVGFPPYFAPHTEADSRFSALSALAYGVQGFNLYMAVERSRWIGAPIDETGTPREEAAFYRKLVRAVIETRLFELRRRSSVTVVVPREVRRLARVLHALDPLSPTLLSAMSGDGSQGPGEQDLGLPSSVITDTLEFLNLLEQALDRRHLPYTVCAGDQLQAALDQSRWTIVLCCSALAQEELARLEVALENGAHVTLGPHYPDRDSQLQPAAARPTLKSKSEIPLLVGLNEQAIENAVATAASFLALETLDIELEEVQGTLFETHDGRPSVAFLINPTSRDLEVSWRFDDASSTRDVLTNRIVPFDSGVSKHLIVARSVRMLELTRDS